MLEKQLKKWAERSRPHIGIPARLALWDGREFDFGHHGEPVVTLRANSAGALNYLLRPSLDKLGEAYVRGMIDIEGRLADAIELAYSLAHLTQTGFSRFDLALRRFRHSPDADAQAISYHYDVSDEFYAACDAIEVALSVSTWRLACHHSQPKKPSTSTGPAIHSHSGTLPAAAFICVFIRLPCRARPPGPAGRAG